jgi:uncharacterized protein YpmB
MLIIISVLIVIFAIACLWIFGFWAFESGYEEAEKDYIDFIKWKDENTVVSVNNSSEYLLLSSMEKMTLDGLLDYWYDNVCGQ